MSTVYLFLGVWLVAMGVRITGDGHLIVGSLLTGLGALWLTVHVGEGRKL